MISKMDSTQKDNNQHQDKTADNRDLNMVSIHFVGAKNDALLLLLQRKVKCYSDESAKFKTTKTTQKFQFYTNIKNKVSKFMMSYVVSGM